MIERPVKSNKQRCSLATVNLSVMILLVLLFGGCDPEAEKSRGPKVIMVRAPPIITSRDLKSLKDFARAIVEAVPNKSAGDL